MSLEGDYDKDEPLLFLECCVNHTLNQSKFGNAKPSSSLALLGTLPYPEGNALDHFLSKTRLQAFKDFLTSIPDNFTQPNAVVHVDK